MVPHGAGIMQLARLIKELAKTSLKNPDGNYPPALLNNYTLMLLLVSYLQRHGPYLPDLQDTSVTGRAYASRHRSQLTGVSTDVESYF